MKHPGGNAMLFLSLGLGGLLGCQPASPALESTVQEVRAGQGGVMGFDVLITDSEGQAVRCGDGKLDITVEARRPGGSYAVVDAPNLEVTCSDGDADVALVIDNSGSERGHLGKLRTAARGMLDGVLAAGGQVSMVRVSTNAEIQVYPTENAEAVNSAIDAMHVSNGWTSLYDGIRMGNETIGGTVIEANDSRVFSSAAEFCSASRKAGIVVFTDGRENNSADEHMASYDVERYPGDGFATTLGDLKKLQVNGASTPIYTVGLGRNVDEEGLRELAEATGGRYLHAETAEQLPLLFDHVREYFGASHQVCVDLPMSECGDVDVRITYNWTNGSETQVRTKEETVHIACPAEGSGRVATVVLTMSNPGIAPAYGAQLARQAVDWVAPAAAGSKVLVVRDDGHHNEFKDDPLVIRGWLASAGYNVTFIEEPRGGLRASDLDGYQVVWFSNPGYPMDDIQSFHALRTFSANGGGVVLQGDDITWAMGQSFSLAPLTKLSHVNNGTSTCNKTTDNNGAHKFTVGLHDEDHPLLGTLARTSFRYGDDIDKSTPLEGAHVLGTASFASGQCVVNTPALVVTEPSTAPSGS